MPQDWTKNKTTSEDRLSSIDNNKGGEQSFLNINKQLVAANEMYNSLVERMDRVIGRFINESTDEDGVKAKPGECESEGLVKDILEKVYIYQRRNDYLSRRLEILEELV